MTTKSDARDHFRLYRARDELKAVTGRTIWLHISRSGSNAVLLSRKARLTEADEWGDELILTFGDVDGDRCAKCQVRAPLDALLAVEIARFGWRFTFGAVDVSISWGPWNDDAPAPSEVAGVDVDAIFGADGQS